MRDTTPTLWVVIATGTAAGLQSSIIGYALLGLPLVKVKAEHRLRIDANGARVESGVRIANVRGRPVEVDEVWLILRGQRRMVRPREWTFDYRLTEGDAVLFWFNRDKLPKALPVVLDSAGRVWPRRRTLRIRFRGLRAGPMLGYPWRRNGPTPRQIEGALKRNPIGPGDGSGA